ncbi:MAG: hypothetical protein JO329_16400 [Planctomycetaceae bacterium]|nr:hypothetical protein [Planctomycetaceae bacterium]MBV8382577.1 hypothetical protein [Planctomycetaceae bacterium]
MPGTTQAFASTQAAWRFYANPRVTLPQLVRPLIEAARAAVEHDNQHYALVVHDNRIGADSCLTDKFINDQ